MEKRSGRTKFPWRNGPVMEKLSALHETFLPVTGRPKRVISSQIYNYNRLNRQMLAAGRAFLLTERSLDLPSQPDLLLAMYSSLCPYQLIKQRNMKTVKCSSQPQYKKRISLNYTQLVTAIVIIMYSSRNQIVV